MENLDLKLAIIAKEVCKANEDCCDCPIEESCNKLSQNDPSLNGDSVSEVMVNVLKDYLKGEN